MIFSKVTLLGAGLLGGSLAKEISHRKLCQDLVVWARNKTLVSQLKNDTSLAFNITSDIQEACAQADLVILCTPIGTFEALLLQAVPFLKKSCLVTDVGSVKATVVDVMRQHLSTTCRWIGSHPMAGSDESGWNASRLDLFQNATTVVTPTKANSVQDIKDVGMLWEAVGCRVVNMDALTHDRLVAQISHLPHLLASLLTLLPEKDALELKSSGFRDCTRIAGGEPVMWEEIFHHNRTAVIESLDRLMEDLNHFRSNLHNQNRSAVKDVLTKSSDLRKSMRFT